MDIERIACVASRSPLAQQGLALVEARESLVPIEEANAIVALGGDGFMLACFHRYLDSGLPIYGMNRGTVGFLMNGFQEKGLFERVRRAEAQQLFPLRVTATNTKGETTSALAFNEVSLVRYSNQSANLRISINGKPRLAKLISDGVLVCTPAGSTAYNLSVHGSVIPIGADINRPDDHQPLPSPPLARCPVALYGARGDHQPVIPASVRWAHRRTRPRSRTSRRSRSEPGRSTPSPYCSIMDIHWKRESSINSSWNSAEAVRPILRGLATLLALALLCVDGRPSRAQSSVLADLAKVTGDSVPVEDGIRVDQIPTEISAECFNLFRLAQRP